MIPMDCNYIPPPQDWIDRPAIHERYSQPCYDFDQDEIDQFIEDADGLWFPPEEAEKKGERTIQDLFSQHADKWENETRFISSATDLTAHPSYQAVIDLGPKAIPLLLADLQTRKRFWFPALYAITGIRPFDPTDAGNRKRMTAAWVQWGKRKGLL
jgi:hypothetical protein